MPKKPPTTQYPKKTMYIDEVTWSILDRIRVDMGLHSISATIRFIAKDKLASIADEAMPLVKARLLRYADNAVNNPGQKYWRTESCPFCGNQHVHLVDRGRAPKKFLGPTLSKCVAHAQQYYLIDIEKM